MSIAMAAIVAGIAGVAATNVIAWLRTENSFNIRHSVASGILAFVVGIPLIVTAFREAIPIDGVISEEAQLSLFAIQIAAIAGFDRLAKGGFNAAVNGAKKKNQH